MPTLTRTVTDAFLNSPKRPVSTTSAFLRLEIPTTNTNRTRLTFLQPFGGRNPFLFSSLQEPVLTLPRSLPHLPSLSNRATPTNRLLKMRSTRICIILVALLLCVSSLGAEKRHARLERMASVTASVYRDFRDSPVSYNNPDVDMDATQIEALMLAASNDMAPLATLWTQTNLLNACRSVASPSGILSCTDDGFPTVISVSIAPPPGSPPVDRLSGSLANLTELSSLTLNLAGSTLVATLPAAWGQLTHLTTLSLADAIQINGQFPAEWNNLTSLASLSMTCQFVDNVHIAPPEWISRLTTVNLKGANFGPGADLPESWLTSSTLTTLVLQGIRWSGKIPESLASNSVIETLVLAQVQNGLNGAYNPIPTDLSGMSSLKTFAMQFHPTKSVFPTSWPSSLVSLSLKGLPYMTGTIPQSLLDISSLTDLTLSSLVTLGGSLIGPSSPSLSNMQTLDITSVGFTGPVSSAWFFIPSLTAMYVSGSSASIAPFELGTLPPVDSGLCKLQTLVFSQMQLSGSLPPALFSVCPDLTFIDLSSNNLIGNLPTNWSKSNGVTQLDFSGNRFTGSIPSDTRWKTSDDLRLSLASNVLTGSLPVGINSIAWNLFDISGNNIDLCAGIGSVQPMNQCKMVQLSNDNWCPCSSTWTDAGCDLVGADCAVPSSGPSPLADLPPYTPGETLPPSYDGSPANTPVTGSPSSTPSSNPSSTPTSPSSSPTATTTPNVPIGAASSTSVAISVMLVCFIAFFML